MYVIRIVIIVAIMISTSMADLVIGKIKNKITISGIVLGVIINAISILLLNEDRWRIQLYNIFIVTAIAIIMYAAKLWAGGDAKTIVALALLYPIDNYVKYLGGFLSLWLWLFFSFSMGYIYIVVESFYRLIKRRSRFDLCEIKKQFMNMMYTCTINMLIVFLFNYIMEASIYKIFFVDSIYKTLLSFVLIIALARVGICNSKRVLVTAIISVAVVLVYSHSLFIFVYWKMYVAVFLFMIVRALTQQYNYEIISVQELKEGMIISKRMLFFMARSKVKGLPTNFSEKLDSRLSKEEVDSVLRWSKSKYGKQEIEIVRKIPFAVFISLGLLSYYCLGVIQNVG